VIINFFEHGQIFGYSEKAIQLCALIMASRKKNLNAGEKIDAPLSVEKGKKSLL